MEPILLSAHLSAFRDHLVRQEKSAATVEKYLRDAGAFLAFAGGQPITRELTLAYKQHLVGRNYAAASVNSMLAGLNCLLIFLGLPECRVKILRCQRQTYCPEDRQLTKADYLRLLEASRKQRQLNLILQTLCGTGIRISELRYFTVEAVRSGEISVRCKSKTRRILVPGKLRQLLLDYAKGRRISSGTIFRSRQGNPLDRSNIWSRMKRLCKAAGVNPRKVFPHNLRKLFARTFYALQKDIAKLADILGHSSINTTRIYIMTTGTEHRRQLERLGLIL